MKFGVVVFPGTWSDRDCGWVIDQVLGAELTYLWHKEDDLKGCDCVILPGGFAYGDYLRTGAIARFAPVMERVGEFADLGHLQRLPGPVRGRPSAGRPDPQRITRISLRMDEPGCGAQGSSLHVEVRGA